MDGCLVSRQELVRPRLNVHYWRKLAVSEVRGLFRSWPEADLGRVQVKWRGSRPKADVSEAFQYPHLNRYNALS